MKLFLTLLILFFARPSTVQAFCPLCVVATGTGVGFFRWLGVDDTIIGLWLGGFTLATTLWLAKELSKKNLQRSFALLLSFCFSYLSLLLLCQRLGFFHYPFHKLWGVNRLLLGILLGSGLMALSPSLDRFLRKQNQGKQFISFQKIVVSLLLLFTTSLIFFFLTRP